MTSGGVVSSIPWGPLARRENRGKCLVRLVNRDPMGDMCKSYSAYESGNADSHELRVVRSRRWSPPDGPRDYCFIR
jgi:hypothetical protein